ncbi:tyrosine-type recombinase/integrase [Streptomyces sp. NPDC088925]|uniref:tyrosine-type recombinase/integrase n=1 Tax=Streptomyces sp. NPDC088925 TaxID=3365914 RepID=UPI003821C1E1
MSKYSTYKRCTCKGPLIWRRGPLKGQPRLDQAGKPMIGLLDTACPNLHKSDHGSWYFALELPPGKNNKRRTFRKGGYETQTEASKAADKAWAAARVGVAVDSSETFGAFLQSWFDDLPLKETTAHGYGGHVRLYLIPHLGHIKCADLTFTDVKNAFKAIREESDARQAALEEIALLEADAEAVRLRWKAAPQEQRAKARTHWNAAREAVRAAREAASPGMDRRGRIQRPLRPLTNASLHRIKATLSSALSAAVREERVVKNFAEQLTLPPAKRPKPLIWTEPRVREWLRTGKKPSKVMVWTPEQTGQFLDFVINDRHYPLWHTIIHRGFRRGECCGMTWPEIDLEAGTIHVTQQISTAGYDTLVSTPKADSDRIVYLDLGSWELLRRWQEQQAAERAQWREAGVIQPDTAPLVWTREDGSAYHPNYFSDRFERLVTAAGLPPIRLHDLRHGAATLSLAADVPPKVVQEMLGHSSYHLTMDTYTSVLPAMSKLAAEAVRNVIPRSAASEERQSAPLPAKKPPSSATPPQSPTRIYRTAARRKRRMTQMPES